MSHHQASAQFAQQTSPCPESVQWVELQALADVYTPRRSPPLTLLWVGVAFALWGLSSWTEAEPITSPSSPSASRHTHHLSADSVTTEEAPSGLRMTYFGEGWMDDEMGAAHIRWSRGNLRLTAPENNQLVTVATPHALVQFKGTKCSIMANQMGTAVHAERGGLAVRCDGTEERFWLAENATHFCWPGSAAGLHRRALAQIEQGHPSFEILETIERGLRVAGSPSPIHQDLLEMRRGLLQRQQHHSVQDDLSRLQHQTTDKLDPLQP